MEIGEQAKDIGSGIAALAAVFAVTLLVGDVRRMGM
jgi:hypothetical protein